MRRSAIIATVAGLLALALGSVAYAQTFSTGDLEGTWELFQLSTPAGPVSGTLIRTYRGQVEFDANGVVQDGSVIVQNEDPDAVYVVSGNLAVSSGAVIRGSLNLVSFSSPSGTLTVREARVLTNRHTIVGASDLFGQGGLFTLAKREDTQTFGVIDIGGSSTLDWNYHEITPSNDEIIAFPNGAAWINGVVTFHGSLDANPGCTEADLFRSDGTIRSQTRGTGDFSFG